MCMYKTILIDPPWNERGAGKIKRGADRHYKLLKTDDIIDTILNCEKFTPDKSGCHLYLWVTNNFLQDGLRVMSEIGFRYITNLVWVKDKMGLGQYFRGQHELCLFGVMGKLKTLRSDYSTVIKDKRKKHSQKPDIMYSIIEDVSPPPRLELFARNRREGWDCWGDSIPEDSQAILK